MSDFSATPRDRHAVTFKRLLVPIADAERVTVRRSIALPGRTEVALDVYMPPTPVPGASGCVVFVTGLPDPGARRMLGCAINEMASFSSWATAVAASGLVAITYTTGGDPAGDLPAVIAYLREHGSDFQIDPTRLALWACSSHVPNALGLMLSVPDAVRCAALCYGFMFDEGDSQAVADAQRTWGFANPAHGRHAGELPRLPLLLVRAGRDTMPGINVSIDAFVLQALVHNLPFTLINHPEGAHAFDLDDDSRATRRVVAEILTFLKWHTTGARSD